jgi:hypothetical protein
VTSVDTGMNHAYGKHLFAAGMLAMAGLLTALIYILRSTPYTMILFLGAGQTLLIAAVAVFLWVVASDIRARLQSVVEKRFKKGEVIFRQGDPPDRLYSIGRGEVEIVREDLVRGEAILARLGPGEFFGEMGILANAPRMATVRAATDLEVLSIHRVYFGPLLSYLPSLREGILAEYRRRSEHAKREGKGTPDGPGT